MAPITILSTTLGISAPAAAIMVVIALCWAFAIVYWVCTGFWKLLAFGIKTVVVFGFMAITLIIIRICVKVLLGI